MTTVIETKARHWRWPGWPSGLTENSAGVYRWSGGGITRSIVDACLAALGRAEGPALLWDLRGQLDLGRDEMSGLVAAVYAAAEHRRCVLGRGEWVEALRANRFSHNGIRVDPPTEPVTVFRGCWPELIPVDAFGNRVEFDALGQPVDPGVEIVEVIDTRRGLSWSRCASHARKFAHGGVRGERQVGAVYSATVRPEFLLARIGSEYLVDPIGLRSITVVEVALDVPTR